MLPQEPLQAGSPHTTLSRSYYPTGNAPFAHATILTGEPASQLDDVRISRYNNTLGSTAKGIMIGIFSVLGAAGVCLIIAAIVYYFRYTNTGRIFLDRITRPGEYDDEQQFAKEEAEALEDMDDLQRTEYMRAKAFVQANPPESVQTDISLSQFLAIQEKGVSAWEFEPELEIANCFVEGRTEIEFFDSECSVQSNLPIPKQNEVYYWEAKVYEKPENTSIAIGVTTKPYPLFRLPGYHKASISYMSNGNRRYNQPFQPSAYGPSYVQGDVIGVGYRPRTGTIFFTRNGKKLDDVAHGLKTQNFFPTVGANGPCQVHVNFGQMGFVFIEANVKKWGLAPQTGSLAPPPPYGSEQGSILLDSGREGIREGMGGSYIQAGFGHGRSSSQQMRLGRQVPTSPGPQRSPTDISLAALSLVDSNEDVGEGASHDDHATTTIPVDQRQGLGLLSPGELPPEYSSPVGSPNLRNTADHERNGYWDERAPLLQNQQQPGERSPPVPSYDAAMADTPEIRRPAIRVRSATEAGVRPRGPR
ncbi:Rsp5p-dependent ubiquitination, sorting of cargo proteins at the multivesicular body [Alternaria viburni]|uniref:Rsp5p-dependent ubiquitination, sorting of cargo proteins at the multivesicular body n=1 Tax=Alternaria viburni TaxID=566460 RepID=UPI0020C5A3EC|nr:Rsp5p-dependent ubiquitination, sorting of cargo proteins at the multivesicular body [Alternaria viburni]KAI4657011.1 Rsp5p-dependent ubiquitination, sorting of cargo proteins at the multivesicular body [Alternaria viburni]